jgi:hypothetical protein
MDESRSRAPSLTLGSTLPQCNTTSPPLTWFAGDGLNRQSQLGVRGDRQRLVAWGEGWDHDIRHVDLLKAKNPV